MSGSPGEQEGLSFSLAQTPNSGSLLPCSHTGTDGNKCDLKEEVPGGDRQEMKEVNTPKHIMYPIIPGGINMTLLMCVQEPWGGGWNHQLELMAFSWLKTK